MHARIFRERNALAVAAPGWRGRATLIGAETEFTGGQLRGSPALGRRNPQLPVRHVAGQQVMAVGDLEHLVVRQVLPPFIDITKIWVCLLTGSSARNARRVPPGAKRGSDRLSRWLMSVR